MPVLTPSTISAIAQLQKEKQDYDASKMSGVEGVSRAVGAIADIYGDVRSRNAEKAKTMGDIKFKAFQNYIDGKTLKKITPEGEVDATQSEVEATLNGVANRTYQLKNDGQNNPAVLSPDGSQYIWKPKEAAVKMARPEIVAFVDKQTGKINIDGKEYTAEQISKLPFDVKYFEKKDETKPGGKADPLKDKSAMAQAILSRGYIVSGTGKSAQKSVISNQKEAREAALAAGQDPAKIPALQTLISSYPTDAEVKSIIYPKIGNPPVKEESWWKSDERENTELSKKMDAWLVKKHEAIQQWRTDKSSFGTQTSTPKLPAAERFKALITEGKTEDQAYQALKNEGY